MSDASAKFIIGFGADTSGITQADTALARLEAQIAKDTAALKQMQDAMQRLRGTAEVARWEALPKDIAKAENEVDKLAKKMAALQAKLASAPEGKKGAIADELGKTGAALQQAQGHLGRLKGEQKQLAQTEPVKLFEDLRAASDSTKASLGQAQTAFSRLGGVMKGEASRSTEAVGGLAQAAQQVPGPIGSIASKIQQLRGLGPAAVVAAIAVAVIALGVAVARTAWQFGVFVLGAADAARSAALMREAAAGSAAGARALEGITSRVLAKTAATREEVAALANEYARLRLSARAIEGAVSAVTVATQAMGASAGSTIKGLIDRGVDKKNFWLNALDLKGTGLAFKDVARALAKNMGVAVGAAESALRDGRVRLEDGIKALDRAVGVRFGDIAKKQMLALPVQIARAKANLGRIFEGVDVTPVLAGLDRVLSLLDETTETGRALRTMAKSVLQPLANAAGQALPLLEGFVYGAVLAIQGLVMWGLKAALAVKRMFGGSSLLKDIDAFELAVYAGAGAVGGFVGLIAVLAGAFATCAVSLAIITAPIWLTVAAFVALGVAIWYGISYIVDAVDSALGAFDKLDLGDAVSAIIDGLFLGITGGTGHVGDAFKRLAQAGLKAFKSALGIASPSRVFRAEGRWIPAGVAEGVDDGQPAVSAALAGLASPEAMRTGAASSGVTRSARASAGPRVVVPLNYQGRGSRAAAREMADVLGDALEDALRGRGLVPVGP